MLPGIIQIIIPTQTTFYVNQTCLVIVSLSENVKGQLFHVVRHSATTLGTERLNHRCHNYFIAEIHFVKIPRGYSRSHHAATPIGCRKHTLHPCIVSPDAWVSTLRPETTGVVVMQNLDLCTAWL